MAAGCGYNPALTPVHATNLVVPTIDGMRTVKTLLVIDPLWHPLGNERPIRQMEEVSAAWERDFGIRFEIVEVERDRIFAINSIRKLRRLAKLYPADEDHQLVILFTGSTGLLTLEVTEILGNHIVVGPSPIELTKPIIHHGLGHIFGAPHSLLPGNYMTAWAVPMLSMQTASIWKFSNKAEASIRTNKWRIFTLDEPLAEGFHVPRVEGQWEIVARPMPDAPRAR